MLGLIYITSGVTFRWHTLVIKSLSARYVTANMGQELLIKSVESGDEGFYTCRATNPLTRKSVKFPSDISEFFIRRLLNAR